MTIEQALITFLKAQAGLTNLVGARIFARDDLPQNVGYPALSISRITTEVPHAMGADPKLDIPLFQFDIWGEMGKGRMPVLDVSTQLKLALRDFTGIMGGAGGVTVERAFYDDELDLPAEPATKTLHRMLQFEIPYRE